MIDIAAGQQPSPVDSIPAAVAPDGEPAHAASIAPERRAEIAKKATKECAERKSPAVRRGKVRGSIL
jgi:hypothetical protein